MTSEVPGGRPAGSGSGVGKALLSVADYRREATRLLSPELADFLNRGTYDGLVMARNERGFADVVLNGFRFVDVSEQSTSTSVLGSQIDVPVLIAPTGLHRLAHPDGEIATARAAARAGTFMSTGTMATSSVEDVAAVGAPTMFQMYNMGRDVMAALADRAESAGCRAICLTVDIPVQIRGREHDRRNRFRASRGQPLANFEPSPGFPPSGLTPEEVRGWKRRALRPVSTDDVRWLATHTSLPLVVKGVLTPEDAERAVEAGAGAVIVSNHGGREDSDAVAGAIEVLPEVVARVGDRAEVLLDGGVRRGADVARALALGARAVLIGRPFWWGLVVAGEEGVANVLEILRTELRETMVAIGCPDVRGLGREHVHRPEGAAARLPR